MAVAVNAVVDLLSAHIQEAIHSFKFNTHNIWILWGCKQNEFKETHIGNKFLHRQDEFVKLHQHRFIKY